VTESQTALNENISATKKVPIQDRSVLVGDVIFVNGYGVNRTILIHRFAEGGYLARETPHFLRLLR